MHPASASCALAAQAALLRSLHDERGHIVQLELQDLRTELARCMDREGHLMKQLTVAQRQLAASAGEAEDLRRQLERQTKLAAWEARKASEAAAAASTSVASMAASTEEKLRAEIARQAALLQKQESELKAAQMKEKTLRRRLDEHSLQRDQHALISQLAAKHVPSHPPVSRAANDSAAAEHEVAAPPEREAVKAGDPGHGAAGIPDPQHADDALISMQDAFIARLLRF